jgi:hypothetical protein
VPEQEADRSGIILANPSLYVPKIMFFTKGKGLHKDYLTSFELALRDAQIADLNLVSVSSIKPPGCRIVSIQGAGSTSCRGRWYLPLWRAQPRTNPTG